MQIANEYGFKLHIITNAINEMIDFMITKGNVDDKNQSGSNSALENYMINFLPGYSPMVYT